MIITPHSIVGLPDHVKIATLTGGPCGGKTGALAFLKDRFTSRGYRVFVAPEAATYVIGQGAGPKVVGAERFQELVVSHAVFTQAKIVETACMSPVKTLVLFDRGVPDGRAYVDEEVYIRILAKHELKNLDVCHHNCHGVFHLRTAACGAESFYTLLNNNARTETPEQARELDGRTLDAWRPHHHLRVFDNSTTFEGKLHRVYEETCSLIGDPLPLECERKFIIHGFNISDIPVPWVDSRIVQDYLVSPTIQTEVRVRAREDQYGTSYSCTTKTPIYQGVRIEQEKLISKAEYSALLALRNPRTQTISKRRICFLFQDQLFEVDIYDDPIRGWVVMEIELSDRNANFEIPDFFKNVTEVTGDRQYSNAYLAGLVD